MSRVSAGVAVAAMALLSSLSSGCLTSFEGRFAFELEDAHIQSSPGWSDPGLYDSLPHNGTYMGFEVTTNEGPVYAGFDPWPDSPEVHEFRDAGLAAIYGNYSLDQVRWREVGDDPRTGMAFHLSDNGLHAWIGYDVPEADVRARVRALAASFYAADDFGLDYMEAEFMASRNETWMRCEPPSCYITGGHDWTGAGIDGASCCADPSRTRTPSSSLRTTP